MSPNFPRDHSLQETRGGPFFRVSSGPGWALAGDAGHHKDPVIARGIADAIRDADLVASAVLGGWHCDLDAALAEYGRQRDHCAIPLSDANLGIARLDAIIDGMRAFAQDPRTLVAMPRMV
jgi:flavin-dependent dehydrogenase